MGGWTAAGEHGRGQGGVKAGEFRAFERARVMGGAGQEPPWSARPQAETLADLSLREMHAVRAYGRRQVFIGADQKGQATSIGDPAQGATDR